MAESSSEATTTKLLQSVQSDSYHLLRSCTKLAEALPLSEPQFLQMIQQKSNDSAQKKSKNDHLGYASYLNDAVAGTEWPNLLGDFRSLSNKLADLGSKADGAELKHVVAVPTDPVPKLDGTPSMFIPELLRTKRPPEQELKDDRVRKLVQPMIQMIPCDAKGNPNEKEATIGVVTVRSMIHRYNSSIDRVLEDILSSKVRGDIKRKCDAAVAQFSVSNVSKPPQVVLDFMTYLHTGRPNTKFPKTA